MNSEKVFYFFVENEFVCQPDVNLLEAPPINYSSNAITINLVSFTSKGIKEVSKIFGQVTPNVYGQGEMVNLYNETKDGINLNFINNDVNKLFIGCVRDDNGTHRNCTQENLGFICRTDPIHDIFNILKNIYLSKGIIVDDNLRVDYGDLFQLLRSLYGLIPIVGYYDLANVYVDNRNQRIWIPDRERSLKYFMEPIRYLFSINYYEKVDSMIPDNMIGAKAILQLIFLLKKILKFTQETIIDAVTINVYRDLYNQIQKYSFEDIQIRCLNSLKTTMKTNIKFFEEHKVPFKAILFSTLMIEAEKGKLQYEACFDPPTTTQCNNWFDAAMMEGFSDLDAYSEFGKFTLNFSPLETEPMEVQNN